jgi:16S rRNA (uracil1498-N3)-methyltransferase
MDRFFVPQLSDGAVTFSLDAPDECHHLLHVLRLKPGVRAEFINGKGLLAVGEIVALARDRVDVRIVESRAFPSHPAPGIILACAMPKRVRFEEIIDKCTQLGVDEIIPMMTERTEVVVRDKDIEAKCTRFEKVAVAAVKQSKRLWAPVIHRPARFADILGRISSDTLSIIPWLEGDRIPLNKALAAAAGKKEILFLIGPEGDFTSQEVELARAKGAVPVSLGPNVLRVDTAAELVVGAAGVFLGQRTQD